ncbi:CpaD family pilus assembly lipoprotein [Sphingobium nicotianae]|uniref:Lipoprotein n=1 Tax=Sphingobium nicotianae TaxID=2782607 RepID=A0A9X1DFL6_9SPHN|nr:CpaD family pilus assembly lipoprotein [Sphingobium nicotianae]MBT2189080.1 hypothetical protein [Sphingobium nicotianae]
MNLTNLIKRHSAIGTLMIAASLILSGCVAHDQDAAITDRASMSPCPQDQTSNGAGGGVGIPLGCNNRANLRAMVADVKDLDQGQALEPASGIREARAVEAYHKGAVKKLSTGNDTGSSSEAAQTTPQTR